MAYQDMREYLEALENAGRLHRVSVPVDKDWEIAAVCRKLFQDIPQASRPAILFEKVIGFDVPVVAGILGASKKIYAMALSATEDQMWDVWEKAEREPIPVRVVESGPIKENIKKGDEVNLLDIPVPVWTVEHDPNPYLTSPYIVTRDPITGVPNVGTYRLEVKGRNRLGIFAGKLQDMGKQMQWHKEHNEPMPVAIILGAEPTIGLASVAKIPYGMDEFEFAGGLRGEPVELVHCETVPLQVPVTAEFVLEGWIQPGNEEVEGPFGEYPGYMGPPGMHPVIEIDCVMHRNHPIYQAFVSQMPPSESSCIRGLGREQSLLKALQGLGLRVKDVHYTEASGATAYMVISIEKRNGSDPMNAALAAWGQQPNFAKFITVVDDDIDIRDPFQVEWAMSFRVQPAHDIQIFRNTQAVGLDPSNAPNSVPQHDPRRQVSSKVFIDATKKHEFPPAALPPREHLDKVMANWERYGF